MAANPKGKAEEDFAAETLTALGYKIVGRNVYSAYGEVDIIAEKEDVICFIEVKARRSGSTVTAAEAVGRSKQKKIISTALLYLQQHPKCGLQPRFDLFSVLTDGRGGILSYDFMMEAFDGEAYNR